ncbi:VCBS repeat-containing protein [Roseovarius sp. MMSF_3359]|uniref:FG-GAP repeat domain-containing protein n=1 Tax=Roseovarius sp. MMSF_3359 TaxID=3046707 RepID=UPI00273F79D6|nr:VCBS repeat-containing protein [Roseovarius sp. MMSF_3359]
MNGARRILLRRLQRSARRAVLPLCFWLPLLAPVSTAAQGLSDARYVSPTDIYPHGALGDNLEWAAVEVTVSRPKGAQLSGPVSRTYRIKAPARTVFEDTEPRLWDIDGDGLPEVVVVISHQDRGARLAVIGYDGDDFRYIATTPAIGTRFRWLAPIGAADLDGDGRIEIAYIDRPHLAKTLRIWRFAQGELRQVAERPGLTNHKIGWDYIPGGVRNCGGVVEIISANADWSHVMASRFANGVISSRKIARHTGPADLNAALSCS